VEGLYHELRRRSSEAARAMVRKVLQSNGGNVSKTARILGVSRKTVRRAREGPLEDLSRRPKRSPRRTRREFEGLIVAEAKRTGYRYLRLHHYLRRKYALEISPWTIKAILRRGGVPQKRRRVRRGRRPLYDYEHLLPFEQLQLDTKWILDKKGLPGEVYEHIKGHGLPIYQWTLIDVATRARFLAYSWELSATFGAVFLGTVVLWLRAHGVRWQMVVRMDRGSEFCGSSWRKQRQWQEVFGRVGVELDVIPPRATHLMGVVERSHRSDDEEFLMIHAERCMGAAEFIDRAQRWQDTWNFFRPHYGRGMVGRTPQEVLRERSGGLLSPHVLKFPVVLLETLLREVNLHLLTFPFHLKSGTNVHASYPEKRICLIFLRRSVGLKGFWIYSVPACVMKSRWASGL